MSLGKHKKIVTWLGGFIGLFLLLLALWILAAGPVTVGRILQYGNTTIDDFKHYPGRKLRPSDLPSPFKNASQELAVSDIPLPTGGKLGKLDALLESNDSLGFLIIQNDTIVYERYFQGHAASSLSQAFSMSKSFTSALVGMAIDDGYINNVDQTITEFVPELKDAGFDKVTIRHLLTMTSGSSYDENDNPFGEHLIFNYTPQLETEILKSTLESPPGKLFRYKSGDNALLALALSRSLKNETITSYMQRRFWNPLGMEYGGIWSIDHEGDGLEKTWCCLAATTRDFAKLGRLYLHNGIWNQQALLSPSWIKHSVEGKVYGYQWWLLSEAERDYVAIGKSGQYLYVNPTKNLLIVRVGKSHGNLENSDWTALFQTIASSIPIDDITNAKNNVPDAARRN